LAFLVPSAIWLIAFGISVLFNKNSQPVWVALATLPVIFLVNYGEEIGWRGYALPCLMRRFNPLVASLILGLIWALFHAALYWQRPSFGLMASLIILLVSVILAWIFVNTQKILPGTLFHAMFNAWTQVFVVGDSGERLLVVVCVLLLIVCGYLLLLFGKGLKVN
jgi:membrane protease YdiL (CAAX protease family)